jgi:hypothetical protein
MDKAFKIAVVLSAYDKMSTIINGAVDKSTTKLGKLKHSFKEFGEKSLIMGEGGTEFFRGAVEAAEQSEVAEKRLKQVMKSMGKKDNEAAEAALNYANALQHKIGVEDEDIAAVQAKLATFSQLIGENAEKTGAYNRATKLTFDMQATGFGDAMSNATQLGKALQNPALGSGALSKAGAVNKEDIPLIKQIQATKGLAAAQEFLLKAVEKQVGGVAEATTTSTQKSKIAWHAVEETIGKKLLPVVDRFATFLGTDLIPKFEAFIDKNPTLVKWLAGLSVGMLVLGVSCSVISFGFGAITTVVGLAGTALTFFGGIVSTVSTFLLANPIVLIVAAIAAAAYLIYRNWEPIKAWFIALWDKVTSIFKKAWNWIKNMFMTYTAADLVIKHWVGISNWFTNLWAGVKNIFGNSWEWIKGLFSIFAPAEIVYKHWDQIVEYFTNVWDKVKNIFKNAWASIKSGVSSFFGFGDADKVAQHYEKTLNAVNEKTSRAMGFNGSSTVNFAGGPGSFAARPIPANSNTSSINFSPIINVGPGGAQDAAVINNTIQTSFQKQMKDYQQQQQRKQF